MTFPSSMPLEDCLHEVAKQHDLTNDDVYKQAIWNKRTSKCTIKKITRIEHVESANIKIDLDLNSYFITANTATASVITPLFSDEKTFYQHK